jgi:hypothetical protein
MLLVPSLAQAALVAPPPLPQDYSNLPWSPVKKNPDFNGDGKDDLFVRDSASGDTFFALSTPVGFDPFLPIYFAPAFNYVTFVDFNGDGKDDLFVRDTTSGSTFVAYSNGAGFDPFLAIFFGSNFSEFSFWNFDTDGRPDIFMRDPNTGQTYIRYALSAANGFGSFQPLFFGANFSRIFFANFDGDDGLQTDILVRDPDTGSSFVTYAQVGSFSSFQPISFGPNFDIVELANFSGNFSIDLFVRDSSSGQTYVSLVQGSTFGPFQPIFFGASFTRFEVHQDLNGDGLADLFVRNPQSGDTFYALSTGSGFGAFQPLFFGTTFTDFDFEDFNGDGASDLFVRNPQAGESYIRQSDGSGRFGPFLPIHFAQSFGLYGFEQFDGDAQGKADLLVRDNQAGKAFVAHSNGNGFNSFIPVPYASRFGRTSVGDFNGDGTQDLLVRDEGNGDTFRSDSTVGGFGAFVPKFFTSNFTRIWPPPWKQGPPPQGANLSAVLLAPLPNSQIILGETLVLEGFGSSASNDELPAANIEWFSDQGGGFLIGTGRSVATTGLGLGHHTITLKTTDPGGGTFKEIPFGLDVVLPSSPTFDIITTVRAWIEDVGRVFNGAGNTLLVPLCPNFRHNQGSAFEFEAELLRIRTEEQMQPSSVMNSLPKGMVLDPMGTNLAAPLPGDRVKVSWIPSTLSWTHSATGEPRQCGAGSFLRETFVEWDGARWLVCGNQEFNLESVVRLSIDEGRNIWDAEIQLSVESSGVTTPTSAAVEMRFLSGVIPRSGAGPADFDATSDLMGWLDLPFTTGPEGTALKAIVHIGDYLNGNRSQDVVQRMRDLQGLPVHFRIPDPMGGFRDVFRNLQFGFDPGFLMQNLAAPPSGAPGLVRGDRLIQFSLDTAALTPGGGPGTLGVLLGNRPVIVPVIAQNLRGELRTDSPLLQVEADCMNPLFPPVDSQSYGVVTSSTADYDVEVEYCDVQDNCFLRRKRFTAP